MSSSYTTKRRQNVGVGVTLLLLATMMLLAIISSSSTVSAFTSRSTAMNHPQQAVFGIKYSDGIIQQQQQQQQQHRSFSMPTTTTTTTSSTTTTTTTRLHMAPPGSSSTLKPAATPLMDSGKAVARSGELLIEFTRSLKLYGGALSSAGAQIRNSGDCLAQAAASCRFKTGVELVIDELREAATCLSEATDKLKLAKEEAEADQDLVLEGHIVDLIGPMAQCSIDLEAAGAGILLRKSLKDVGTSMVGASKQLESISRIIGELAESKSQNADGALSSQRMQFASERLKDAGIELRGDVKPKKTEGRAFLKGGGF